MRATLLSTLLLGAALGCGSVDESPLGGPFGGSTDLTDPNGQTQTPGEDASAGPTEDAGAPKGSDSGTPPPAKDAGNPTPQDAGGQPPPSSAPTWTAIFNSYMKSGTKGRCSSCHSQGSSASSLYTWLQGRGYISGAGSALVDPNQSCLSWYNGNMPPSGPTSYSSAVSDMNAWAAAGAANN